jgi:hypothetical protein
MHFKNEYRYVPRFGNSEHIWTCIGSLGAMHFHVTDLGEEYEETSGIRYSAGLEMHSRAPLSDTPPHEKCWLIGGPCWHDGTSLYAQETIVPFWQQDPHDHERMFRFIEREYERRFMEEIKG